MQILERFATYQAHDCHRRAHDDDSVDADAALNRSDFEHLRSAVSKATILGTSIGMIIGDSGYD